MDFFSPELIGAIMIGCMLFAIFIGFPISFTLIFLGIVFGYWGFGKDTSIQYDYDRKHSRRGPTLYIYGNFDGASWINGKIV